MTSARTNDWVDGIARRVIQHAARGAGDGWARRLEEEWLADLALLPRPLTRLRFAAGCHRAAYVIAHEQPIIDALPAVCLAPKRDTSIGLVLLESESDDSAFFSGSAVSYLLICTLLMGLLFGFVAALI